MQKLTITALIISMAAICSSPAYAQDDEEVKTAGDAILLKGKPPQRNVTVTEDTWSKVAFERGGVPQKLNTLDVSFIQYGEDKDGNVKKAISYISQGKYGEAIEKFLKPLESKLGQLRKVQGRPWAEQYCFYYLGLAHLRRADATKNDAQIAENYFSKLLSSSPKTRFYFEATEGLGESYLLAEKYGEAAKHYAKANKKLNSMAGAADIPKELGDRLRRGALLMAVRNGEAYIDGGKADKSTSILRNAARIAENRKFFDIYFNAKATIILAHIATGAFELGITNARDLIKDGEKKGKPEYIGQAYYALAECHFARAEDRRKKARAIDADDYRAARCYYSRQCAMYFDDARYLPKAMYRSAICSKELIKLSKNKYERKQAANLLKRQVNVLLIAFPKSKEAKEAKSLLK